MAEFKFDASSYSYNPLTNTGDTVTVIRDDDSDKAEVALAVVNTLKGNRVKFKAGFNRFPSLIFEEGELEKTVDLTGIAQDDQKLPATVNIRISNVSEGDTFVSPSLATINLVTKTSSNSKKQNTKGMATSTDFEKKMEKMLTSLTSKVDTISKRVSTLEQGEKSDKDRDMDLSDKLDDIDEDNTKNAKLIEQVLKTLGVGITSTPSSNMTATAPSKPSSNSSSVAEIVREVLVSLGLTPGTSTTGTQSHITMPDGKKIPVIIPPKPNCPGIPTTVFQYPEPTLKIMWEDCPSVIPGMPGSPTTPTTNICGTPSSPKYVTLENGWRNTVEAQPFPNAYDRTGYYRDGYQIFLMGNVSGTSAQLDTSNKTKVIFKIPKECAPKTQQSFAVSGKTTNGGIEAVELVIYPQSDGSAVVYAQNEGVVPDTIAISGSYLIM